MAADIACINFGYQYEYEKFIGILLFMPIITAVLDNWLTNKGGYLFKRKPVRTVRLHFYLKSNDLFINRYVGV